VFSVAPLHTVTSFVFVTFAFSADVFLVCSRCRLILCVQSLCLFTSLYCSPCSTLPLATGLSTGQPTALHTFFIHLSAGLTASKRPHVMSQPRLRSPPRIALHQHSSSTASSPPDSFPVAPGSAASPSKVSPYLTPLPQPTCSRSPPLPSHLLTVVRALLRPHPSPMGPWALGLRLLPTRHVKLTRKGSGSICRRTSLSWEICPIHLTEPV
jgi:hypothetical protein